MKSLRIGRIASSHTYICEDCRHAYGVRRFSWKSLVSGRTANDRQPAKKEETQDAVVKWYEEDRGSDGKVTQVEETEDAETSQLKSRIDRLEEDLKGMRTSGMLALPPLISQLVQATRGSPDNKMRDDLKEALKDPSLARDVELLGRLTKSLLTGKDIASDGSENISRSTVKIATRKEQRVYLSRLNGYLKQAEALGVDVTTRKQLWRWYLRCKQSIPNFLSRLTSQTLNTLWDAQAVFSTSNPDRSAHLKTLAEDIIACGYQLTFTQRMAYIETLFLEGERDKAIQEWYAHEKSFSEDVELAEAFSALGVRMLAAKGNAEEAHRIAYDVLNSNKVKDARILIPVITSWTKGGGNIGLRRAWAAYIRLRELLGREMVMEDYDVICKSFLDAARADLALGVFKDMMLSGDPSSDQTSPALFKKALGTIADMQSLAHDSPEINKFSLEAMTVLPRRFQNKFFYGSWIKKLLGAGDADSAALVVELMLNRSIQPDAKYLNGIIGAWIRQGKAASCEKAEKMGWAMIDARKSFAWSRREAKRGRSSSYPSFDQLVDEPRPDANIKFTRATLETFSILIEYYLGRQNHDQIRWLHRSIRLAEIEPDAFFMTHVLQSQLKTDGLRQVWQTYSDWAHKRHGAAKPDAETFAFLWECAWLRAVRTPSWRQKVDGMAVEVDEEGESIDQWLDHSNNAESLSPAAESIAVRKELGFPSPRALFGEMISWILSLGPKVQKQNIEDFTKDLYDKVIRCFVQDGGGDLVGALVAMYAMRQQFNIWPDEDTAKILITHIARTEASSKRTARHRDDSMIRVTQRLADLSRQRMKFLESRGVDVQESDNRFRDEENLYLIAELVRSVLARTKDLEEVEYAIQRAAWDMGVGGIETGDHLKST